MDAEDDAAHDHPPVRPPRRRPPGEPASARQQPKPADRPPPPPARPGDRQPVGPRGEMLTQAGVEQDIVRVSREMEDLTDELRRLATRAAEAESDYKREFHKWRASGRVTLDPDGPGNRVTNDAAEDYAFEKVTQHENGDLMKTHLLAEAVFTAARDALKAKQSQLDALRTIAANIRAQT